MEDELPSARTELTRLGIEVREEDLAFLQRTLVRQQELLRAMRAQVPPATEPAIVFRPLG
jgi:hypothetical protein